MSRRKLGESIEKLASGNVLLASYKPEEIRTTLKKVAKKSMNESRDSMKCKIYSHKMLKLKKRFVIAINK